MGAGGEEGSVQANLLLGCNVRYGLDTTFKAGLALKEHVRRNRVHAGPLVLGGDVAMHVDDLLGVGRYVDIWIARTADDGVDVMLEWCRVCMARVDHDAVGFELRADVEFVPLAGGRRDA